MKAALHFPDDVKKILIVATSGSGTSAFAREACTYAYVNRMVSRDEVVEIDLSEDSKDNFRDKEGFYLIKNAQKLTRVQREKCLHTLKGIVIFQVDRNEDVSLFDEVRFIIHLPSLNSLTLEDRYGLIEYFFLDESKRLDDRIIVNVGLMQCLLVYPCVNGIKEMKREIAKGIANAYRREKNHTLTLELSDFSPNVRKGLLNMKNRQDVMEFIAHTALFIFDHETTLQTREKDIEADLYQITYNLPGFNIQKTKWTMIGYIIVEFILLHLFPCLFHIADNDNDNAATDATVVREPISPASSVVVIPPATLERSASLISSLSEVALDSFVISSSNSSFVKPS